MVGAVDCSFTCWECIENCPVKEAMRTLPEAEFYRSHLLAPFSKEFGACLFISSIVLITNKKRTYLLDKLFL